MPARLNSLLHNPVAKLAAFGLAALGSVYFGFIGLSVAAAETVVKLYAYYFLLAAFALWVIALARLWQKRGGAEVLPAREAWAAGAVIAVLTAMALVAEPFRSKILFDEFVLQSTAYNLHHFRDTATMVRGYDILGTFLSLDNYLDKRPNFYPFLISLAHDLTGYRTANAYWLNAALYPVVLGLAYYFGRRLAAAAHGGFLAVLLLGSLPLLAQNATGAGMELLNCAMLLAVAALAASYLREPDEDRLSALVLGAVLLAQSRYESALYVLPAALIILLGWWRRRQVVLSWPAVLAPLFLLPCALQNKVLNASRWMWELKADQESRFSVDYFARNLSAAGDFLFGRSVMFANSLTLTGAGLLGLVWLAWHWRRRPSGDRADDALALLAFGLAAVANTVLIMFYYWSSFTDPMASRFSLPLHLVFLFAALAAAAGLTRRWPGVRRWLLGAACLGVIVAASRLATTLYSHTGIDEIEWEKRVVAARPPGTRLVITNKSTLPWLLEKTPSILIGRARLVADRLEYQLAHGGFTEVLVTQSLRPTTAEGNHELHLDDVLPERFELEPVAERRFGAKLTRISRLRAIRPAPPETPRLAALP